MRRLRCIGLLFAVHRDVHFGDRHWNRLQLLLCAVHFGYHGLVIDGQTHLITTNQRVKPIYCKQITFYITLQTELLKLFIWSLPGVQMETKQTHLLQLFRQTMGIEAFPYERKSVICFLSQQITTQFRLTMIQVYLFKRCFVSTVIILQ